MMDSEVKEIFINKNNMLEIIYQTLPIQEKHSCSQKVPISTHQSTILNLSDAITN